MGLRRSSRISLLSITFLLRQRCRRSLLFLVLLLICSRHYFWSMLTILFIVCFHFFFSRDVRFLCPLLTMIMTSLWFQTQFVVLCSCLTVLSSVRGSVSMFDSALFSPRSWQVFTSGIAFLGLCFYAFSPHRVYSMWTVHEFVLGSCLVRNVKCI